jgi:hypothetical protein
VVDAGGVWFIVVGVLNARTVEDLWCAVNAQGIFEPDMRVPYRIRSLLDGRLLTCVPNYDPKSAAAEIFTFEDSGKGTPEQEWYISPAAILGWYRMSTAIPDPATTDSHEWPVTAHKLLFVPEQEQGTYPRVHWTGDDPFEKLREAFRFEPTPTPGYYFIRNRLTDWVLDIYKNRTKNNTPIITWTIKTDPTGYENQAWAFSAE